MKRENINYLVVGIFVVIMAVAFFIVLYKVTGRTGPTDNYYVHYENVTGIKYGTPVLYEGFQVGQVEEITPMRAEGKTSYKIKLDIQKNWPIPADSIATMLASGLLSAITIDIKEGSSDTLLKPGDTIEGQEADNLFNTVNEVANEIKELSRLSIKPLLANMNEEVDSLSEEFRNLSNESIRPVIDKIGERIDKEIINDLSDLLVKLNQSADRVLLVLDEENKENLEEFLNNMKYASTTLNEVLFRIEDTRAAMNEVLLHVDGVVTENEDDIKTSMSDLQKSLNIISQKINAITYHMEGTSRNMHELTRQLRENPSLIIKSSPQTDDEETVQ